MKRTNIHRILFLIFFWAFADIFYVYFEATVVGFDATVYGTMGTPYNFGTALFASLTATAQTHQKRNAAAHAAAMCL